MPLFGGKPEKLHHDAVTAFERGDYSKAEKLFSRTIAKEPTSERYYYRGVIHDIMGDPVKAVQDLGMAADMDPSNSRALYSLSIVLIQAGSFEGSFKAISMAYDVDPDDFRILNHFATLLLHAPDDSIKDVSRALELSRKSCELTDFLDEICLETYQEAQSLAGVDEKDVSQQLAATQRDSGTIDATFEIIAHFEEHFGRKANDLSLQNIVPASAPIAVQTVTAKPESGNNTVIFTTGMSSVPLNGNPSRSQLKFAEHYMLIPETWKIPETINDDIWPWHLLQRLAHYAHQTGTAFNRDADVFSFDDPPSPLAENTDFSAVLLWPNPSELIEPLLTESGRTIEFICVMPIYLQEYELAQAAGVDELIRQVSTNLDWPSLLPGRPSVV